MNPKDLSERLMQFAVRVAKVVDSLPESKLGQHIAGQLIRSGTSPAANYEESCAAESKKDFAHKLSICLKEIKETKVWLRLITETDLLPKERLAELMDETDQLGRIIGQSIVTVKGIKTRDNKD